jgi:hypothetical protein
VATTVGHGAGRDDGARLCVGGPTFPVVLVIVDHDDPEGLGRGHAD